MDRSKSAAWHKVRLEINSINGFDLSDFRTVRRPNHHSLLPQHYQFSTLSSHFIFSSMSSSTSTFTAPRLDKGQFMVGSLSVQCSRQSEYCSISPSILDFLLPGSTAGDYVNPIVAKAVSLIYHTCLDRTVHSWPLTSAVCWLRSPSSVHLRSLTAYVCRDLEQNTEVTMLYRRLRSVHI